jgi:3-dehydroquinate synthetase
MRIEEMQAAKDRREKIKVQVGGWAIIAALSGFAAATWEWFRRTLGH